MPGLGLVGSFPVKQSQVYNQALRQEDGSERPFESRDVVPPFLLPVSHR